MDGGNRVGDIYSGALLGWCQQSNNNPNKIVLANCKVDVDMYLDVTGKGITGDIILANVLARSGYVNVYNCVGYGDVTVIADGSKITAGGVVAYAPDTDVINCVNYGSVTAKTTAAKDIYCGGVVGTTATSKIALKIENCINYGEVHGIYSDGYGTGGIVGISNDGAVENCVNLGNVSGISSVGGIVGLNETEDADVQNCYSAGQVYGAKSGKYMYVGAVVGRNEDNEGYVANCYYLKNSAMNGEGDYCLGGGTSKGSEDYVKNHFYTGSFTSLTSQIEGEKYTGGILIDVLNAMVNDALDEGVSTIKQWVEDVNGYPVPDLRLPVIH
jgi:hypothetical protein